MSISPEYNYKKEEHSLLFNRPKIEELRTAVLKKHHLSSDRLDERYDNKVEDTSGRGCDSSSNMPLLEAPGSEKQMLNT